MAGHNKWSSIKHKKAKTDAQRGKIFTKVVREIIISVKEAGPDPDSNARLRLAIQKAKDANMPNDNINRAIQKAAGQGDTDQLEELTYEAYGPAGVGILIDVVTDNKNRTLPNIKTILNKAGGSLAAKGAVSYQFSQKGIISTDPDADEEIVIDAAIDAGAENVEPRNDKSLEITTDPSDLENVKNQLDSQKIMISEATITMVPSSTVTTDKETAKKLIALIEKLEDDDDVQAVHSNLDIPDELMKALMQE